jgi:tripartite ATP-independent transporter DctP family solute receptor
MRLIPALLAFLLLASPSRAEEAAAPKILYLAHANKNDAGDNPTGAMAVTFKSALEAQAGPSLKVEIFPDGQLGGDAAVVELVKKGIIQSAIVSVGGLGKTYPLIGVLDYPFAFKRIEETFAVFDGPFGQAMGADIKAKTGLELVGFGDTGGFFSITNSKRPVRTPEDMNGLRIRTMGVDSHKAFIKSLGGEPVGIAWSEVYASLKAGVADGQMNPVTIIRFGKLDEVQKYLTLTNHIYTPYVWVANPGFLASLSDDERKALAQAARTAIGACRDLGRKSENSERGLPALKARMQVVQLSDKELDAFKRITQPAIAEVIAKNLGDEGKEWLVRFEDAIAKVQKGRK